MGSIKKFHNLISVQVFIYQAPRDHKAIFCSDIAESSQRKALCMQPGQNAGIQTPPHPSQREQLNQQKKQNKAAARQPSPRSTRRTGQIVKFIFHHH